MHTAVGVNRRSTLPVRTLGWSLAPTVGPQSMRGSLGSRAHPGPLALLGCRSRSLAARSRGEDRASRPELLWPMKRQWGGHLALPGSGFPSERMVFFPSISRMVGAAPSAWTLEGRRDMEQSCR